ncbi:putative S-acyltransferase [Acorus calamus]|uniref:S-acyltransferase n=1 Tax=Acorus calamus TaxID=4465 RepID=A0AAV9C1X9_ACOCL|nr:putative S-acyltransferase [Acorus calamus]
MLEAEAEAVFDKVRSSRIARKCIGDSLTNNVQLLRDMVPHWAHHLSWVSHSVNQTARENYRKRYADSRNPYDKGMLKNIYEGLFRKLPPPKVNFRAKSIPGGSRGRELKGTSASDSGYGEDEVEVDAIQKASGETSNLNTVI